MASSLFARLLADGYFPKELPPPFHTTSFAAALARRRPHLDKVLPVPSGAGTAHSGVHNLARAGTLRRRLGIPNPVLHARVVSLVAAHWPTLRGKFRSPPFSVSTPVESTPASGRARALTPACTLADLSRVRAERRATARVALRADISRFYHSIYTHAIPWALHSKATAKRTRGRRLKSGKFLLGDDLDRALRGAQDGQTLGIPIGPDTSLVIAELLLSAVDRELAKRLRGVQGYRYVDDYELYFGTRAEAEAAATVLQEALAAYELDLNAVKTEVVALPLEYEAPWAAELRDGSVRAGRWLGEAELIRYFDRAFGLARAHPNSHVLSFAVAHLQRRIRPSQWKLLQALLLQVVLAEPGTFRHVVQQFVDARAAGWSIDLPQLARAMNMQITYHARLGHGSEVAWALWTLLWCAQPLTAEAARDLAHIADDAVVALLALDAKAHGLTPAGLRTAVWTGRMRQDELYGPHWLLVYEAAVQGWLPSGTKDHIAADPAFAFLRQHGVSFYDPARSIAPSPSLDPPFVDLSDLLDDDAETDAVDETEEDPLLAATRRALAATGSF